MENPFFSVIIPVHNKEKWVLRTIKSVLNQEFQDFELIIVDDASSDASLNVINSIDDVRIKIFKRKSSGPGGYAARNYGVSKSKANWLVFLDADDVMHSNHLNTFYKNINNNKYILVFINNYSKNINGNIYYRPNKYLDEGLNKRINSLKQLTEYDFICMNNICIHKNLLIDLGCFKQKGYKSGGDVLLWLTIILSQEYIYYDSSITSIWITEGSTITKNPRNFSSYEPVLDIDQVLLERLSEKEKNQVLKIFNRKVINRMLLKKQNGLKYISDAKDINWLQLNLKFLFKTISLVLPKSLYKVANQTLRFNRKR